MGCPIAPLPKNLYLTPADSLFFVITVVEHPHTPLIHQL